MEPTIPNHFVPSLVSFALRAGVAPEPLFAGIGRTLASARDPAAQFSVCEVEALYEALCRATGAPDLALSLGRDVDPERLGLYGQLLTTSGTPRASFAALSEFKSLLHPLIDVVIEERAPTTYLRYQSRDGQPIGDKPYYAEGLFSAIVYASEAYFGSTQPPRYAAFRHAAPSYLRSYERAFRCPLRFGQKVDELCYDFGFLDAPARGASESHHSLRREAHRQLEQREPVLLAQVRRVVLARIAEPELALPQVARALGTNTRSLQRSLRELGTNYRALRDRVRHERACLLLRDPSVTTEATAYALGYRDRGNFVRAFERWSGQSPSVYRELAQNDTPLASAHTAARAARSHRKAHGAIASHPVSLPPSR